MVVVWVIIALAVAAVLVADQLVKRRERYWRKQRDAALEHLRRLRNARWN